MKTVLAFVLSVVASFAFAAKAQVCDVTYSAQVETADGNDVGTASLTVMALPMVDVLDNAAKFLRVLDAASKEQEKGGPYTETMDEVRVCDGGAPVKAQGIEVRGVTLAGSVRIGDVNLIVAKQINDRYRARAKHKDSVGWDHSKAPKVKRDDVGKRK